MNTFAIMNVKATVSSKGQVVIPQAVRQIFGIHMGTELVFETHKNGTLEVKPVKRSIDMFFGRCKSRNTAAMTLTDMEKSIMQAVIENDDSTRSKE